MNRNEYLGGNDAAIIMLGEVYGQSRADLQARKLGLVDGQAISPDMQRGLAMESSALNWVEQHFACHIQRRQEHRRDGALGGTIDGALVLGAQTVVVDAKCPRSAGVWRYRDYGVPAHVQIQMQHYMGLWSADAAIVAVWSSDDWRCDLYDVPRDLEVQRQVREECIRWWGAHIVRREPIESDEPVIELPRCGGQVVEVDCSALAGAAEDYLAGREDMAFAEHRLADAKDALERCWPTDEHGARAKVALSRGFRIAAQIHSRTGSVSYRVTQVNK